MSSCIDVFFGVGRSSIYRRWKHEQFWRV